MYALTYPERNYSSFERVDFSKTNVLEFEPPDTRRFPALEFAKKALSEPESMAIVLNAANEIAVAAFLSGKIGFLQIMEVVEHVMGLHKPFEIHGLDDVHEHDIWARKVTESWISS